MNAFNQNQIEFKFDFDLGALHAVLPLSLTLLEHLVLVLLLLVPWPWLATGKHMGPRIELPRLNCNDLCLFELSWQPNYSSTYTHTRTRVWRRPHFPTCSSAASPGLPSPARARSWSAARDAPVRRAGGALRGVAYGTVPRAGPGLRDRALYRSGWNVHSASSAARACVMCVFV